LDREEQGRLIKLLDALERLEKSKEWQTLKELIFDKSVSVIERQLVNECLVATIDPNKLYRLQGEWAWAKQYSDTNKFIENIRKQLEEIKKRLK